MVKSVAKYVEVMTKITSFFPFWLTLAFLMYNNVSINLLRTTVFFISMFLLDLATTAINNYIDSKGNSQEFDMSRKAMLSIIVVLLTASAALGLWLAFMTDIVILLLGLLCFACGVLYTWGPIPISRQPLGELFSGFFYGVVIPFIILYINNPPGTFLSVLFYGNFSQVDIILKMRPIITLMVFAITPSLATANIMLANNICDVEKDIKVKRFTLPYYLGKSSLYLFAALNYLCFFSTILLVVFRIFPPITLLSLVALIPVQKNISTFLKLQDKSKTFICSVKNFLWLVVPNIFLLLVSTI